MFRYGHSAYIRGADYASPKWQMGVTFEISESDYFRGKDNTRRQDTSFSDSQVRPYQYDDVICPLKKSLTQNRHQAALG